MNIDDNCEVNDPYFFEKLSLYKTAFSPLYNQYVGIIGVHLNDIGELIITAYLASTSKENCILFHPEELTNFVL